MRLIVVWAKRANCRELKGNKKDVKWCVLYLSSYVNDKIIKGRDKRPIWNLGP